MSAAELSPDEEREVLRLHALGMSLESLGAKFRKPYAVIAAALARAHKGRAGAWPFVAGNAWPADDRDAAP